MRWADELVQRGVGILSLADTVGLATPEQIHFALNTLLPKYPGVEIGVHLHSTPQNWQPKLQAAIDAGCKRIDGALKGIGGCPMAGDDLVGNMDTEKMIAYLDSRGLLPQLNREALAQSLLIAGRIFH